MTSSLVGSEMCIRDSLETDFIVSICCSPTASLTNALLVLDARFGSCLLYTSDAADDMCVDLGGR
eukprot:4353451-Prorocentrum_lima.AAC.1